MNDLALLEQAYLSFKRHDCESALRQYRSLAEAGRCNQKTLDFFIPHLCSEIENILQEKSLYLKVINQNYFVPHRELYTVPNESYHF